MAAGDLYQPYALESGVTKRHGRLDHYAVRIGGAGGRVIARDWQLTRDQAVQLCSLLEQARELGREEMIES